MSRRLAIATLGFRFGKNDLQQYRLSIATEGFRGQLLLLLAPLLVNDIIAIDPGGEMNAL